MKTWYLLPFVMVLGVLVGRYLPQDELRTAKPVPKPVEVAPRNDSINSLTRMIQIPDRASHPPRRAPAPQESPTLEENPEAAAVEESPRERRRRERSERLAFEPEDLRARIDEAKALWATRVEIARAQALDRLNLMGEGQEALFDNAINAMNESFTDTLQALADTLAAGAELSPELGARVVSEMSATMVVAYDELTAAVPPEMQGEVTHMELTDFIDPGVIEPLIGVQDKLQDFRPGGGR